MTTNKHTELQALNLTDNTVFAIGHDAKQIKELNLETLEWFSGQLFKGDCVEFRTVEIIAVTEKHSCWKHGYNGQKRDEVISRTENILSEETLKLWKTKKRGWYWIPIKE
jgi:hypothetical protein